MTGLITILVMVVMSVIAPMISPCDPMEMHKVVFVSVPLSVGTETNDRQ